MSIIFSYGSSEDFESKVYNYLFDYLKNLHIEENKEANYPYQESISQEIYLKFKEELEKIKSILDKQYNEFEKNKKGRCSKLSYPSDCCLHRGYIFLVLNFWHINTNPSFSCDGMALLQTEKVYRIESELFY